MKSILYTTIFVFLVISCDRKQPAPNNQPGNLEAFQDSIRNEIEWLVASRLSVEKQFYELAVEVDRAEKDAAQATYIAQAANQNSVATQKTTIEQNLKIENLRGAVQQAVLFGQILNNKNGEIQKTLTVFDNKVNSLGLQIASIEQKTAQIDSLKKVIADFETRLKGCLCFN